MTPTATTHEAEATHDVLIAGGGPTGMMLAAELRLAGIDAAIVERRSGHEMQGIRARGLHARSLEILDQRGVVERFLAAGYTAQTAGFAGVRLDISDFPTRHPYGLALVQPEIERLLGEWIAELGVTVLRGREITGLAEDATGVDLQLADGGQLRGKYLVGCDGGASIVRRAAGIAFSGTEASLSHIIGEVELAEEPEWGMSHGPTGLRVLVKLDSGKVSVLITETAIGARTVPTLDELRAGLVAAYGRDFGVHSPAWLSRFTDATKQVEAYRKGRVLLAGDAAHVHYPAGGHGLNTGLQDAVNLGWKLAEVVRGSAPETLLDSYHAERHPVGARVLRETLAAVAANRQDERSKALREEVAELLALDPARKQMAARATELDIYYDLGGGHPLLGRRMPDLDLETADGPSRVYALLHRARPLLLDLGAGLGRELVGWTDRVEHVEARAPGPWELPVIGPVEPPAAVLVRPDGHAAWVGTGTTAGLRDALATWFGPAVPTQQEA